MSDPLPSPRAQRLVRPGWLDARLVLGVLLVLVSVVVGARVLAGADRSQLVWAASGDLTAGSQLSEGDLQAVRVRLFDSGVEYLRASEPPPVGYVLRRAVGAGELLPAQALGRPEVDVDLRLVTVPVEAGHYPPTLRADQRVDLWMTPDPGHDASAATAPATPAAPAPGAAPAVPPAGARQVLAQVAVHTGPPRDELTASGTVPIVLVVRPDQVAAVVSAMGAGRLDVVRVPREAETAGELVAPAEAR